MTTSADRPSPHCLFADIELDVAQRRVTQRGRVIELSALNFDLLRVLVESAPNVVTYDDLAEKVWERHFVSPENVAQRVKLIRQSLADDASHPRYIETVRSKGYRLIPAVRSVSSELRVVDRPRLPIRPIWAAAALGLLVFALAATYVYLPDLAPAQPEDAVAAAKLPNSIAVLPFRNLSPNPENAYFAASIHEEIIGRLARRGMPVISRTSVMQYADSERTAREIAAELNVETILEGSVSYSDSRVRIRTNLIDAATDASRWSDFFDRELIDVFAVQEEIATHVAVALGIEVSAAPRNVQKQPTTSPEAAALYLMVLDLRQRQFSFDSAVQHAYLDQALELDPDFANAHALKAQVYAISVVDRVGGRAEGDPSTVERLALESANRALELDPDSVPALLALADVNRFFWRWGEALSGYQTADRLTGASTSADLLSWLGDHAPAIGLRERAVQLSPGSSRTLFDLGVTLAQAGRFEAAASALRKAVNIAATEGSTRHWLGQAEAMLGNREEALVQFRIAEQIGASRNPTIVTGQMYSYSRIDEREQVSRLFGVLEELAAEGPVGAGTWALAYLAMENAEEARHWLDVAVRKIESRIPDAGFLNLMTIKTNFHANPLLDEPMFRELRDRIAALD